MLNAIRRGSRSWAMKLILGLLVVAFAIWGVGDIFRGGTGQAVATVGDSEITINEFTAEFQREVAFQSQGREQPLSREQALEQGLDRQVLNRLVLQEVVAQAAREAGLRVPDSVVFADIRNMEAFQSDIGFDRFAFQNFLRQSGLSEAQFMNMMREDTARRQFVNALSGAVSVPDAMASAFYRYQEERRTVRFIEIPASAMDVSDPAEDDLRAFYKSNPEMFRAPEYRTFTVLRLSPDDLMDEVAVPEEEVRQYYEQNQAQYGQPEQRHIQQIVVQDKAQAEALLKKIRGGSSFIAVAEEMDRTEDDIDLGTMTRDELAGVAPALADAAFALAEPGVTEPVETSFGWHVVRVTNIQEDRTQSFEEVRGEIRKELLRDRAIDAVYDLGVSVEDALAGGAPLSEVAQQFDLPAMQYGPLDMSGFTPQDNVPEDAPSQAALDKAFQTEPGAYLELNETEEGGYYVVQVDEVTPSRIKPFEMVEAQVRKAYLRQERRETARTRAEELQKKVVGGTALETIIEDLPFADAVQTASNLSRGGQNAPAAFGRDAVNALFSAAEGRAITAPGVGGDSHLVMEVADISAANPGANPQATQAIADALEQVVANDILEQYRLALYEEYDVRIYPEIAAQALQPGAATQF